MSADRQRRKMPAVESSDGCRSGSEGSWGPRREPPPISRPCRSVLHRISESVGDDWILSRLRCAPARREDSGRRQEFMIWRRNWRRCSSGFSLRTRRKAAIAGAPRFTRGSGLRTVAAEADGAQDDPDEAPRQRRSLSSRRRIRLDAYAPHQVGVSDRRTISARLDLASFFVTNRKRRPEQTPLGSRRFGHGRRRRWLWDIWRRREYMGEVPRLRRRIDGRSAPLHVSGAERGWL